MEERGRRTKVEVGVEKMRGATASRPRSASRARILSEKRGVCGGSVFRMLAFSLALALSLARCESPSASPRAPSADPDSDPLA